MGGGIRPVNGKNKLNGEQKYMAQEELGAQESQGLNRMFVNLRIGKIAQTSNTQFDGFVPAQTKNKSGDITSFFAKPYDKITGYVTDIRWHTHKLADGTVLKSWNITIDTTEQVFVLGVSAKDRPFQRAMNTFLNIDFNNPVRFVGFMGEYEGKPQKVLLMYQGGEKPVQPMYQERWLSRLIINKLKEGAELTEKEEKNVKRMSGGKFDKDYPYIVENADGGWSLDAWNNFLFNKIHDEVIPNVQAANERRGTSPANGSEEAKEAAAIAGDEFAGPRSAAANDDDIPF